MFEQITDLNIAARCIRVLKMKPGHQNPRGEGKQQTNLEHILVQQSRPEHRDAVCADVRIKTSEQVQGVHLFTVYKETHRLAFHTVGYSVPSGNDTHQIQMLFNSGGAKEQISS